MNNVTMQPAGSGGHGITVSNGNLKSYTINTSGAMYQEKRLLSIDDLTHLRELLGFPTITPEIEKLIKGSAEVESAFKDLERDFSQTLKTVLHAANPSLQAQIDHFHEICNEVDVVNKLSR